MLLLMLWGTVEVEMDKCEKEKEKGHGWYEVQQLMQLVQEQEQKKWMTTTTTTTTTTTFFLLCLWYGVELVWVLLLEVALVWDLPAV